jgi:hypothetical protein
MKSVLIVALAISAAWILGLGILALVSANPVTINQKQIRESDLIVTASRKAQESSTLVVTREWVHDEDLGTITVVNLEDAKMPMGQEFLVPIQRLAKGRFQVTPTSLPDKAPLVYPATPEAESQLQSLLESRTE